MMTNMARTSALLTGRLDQPEDLIGPLIFPASDISRDITGITLPVDGGFLAV